MSHRATIKNLVCASSVLVMSPFLVEQSSATDFTAGAVMNRMKSEERLPYIAGVIEGLAYARYMRDGKKTQGMMCIYDWFYKGKDGKSSDDNITLIYAAFGKYPDYPPGVIVETLAEKACP